EQAAPDLLHRQRGLLGVVELLSGAGTGARGPVEPRLRRRLHDQAHDKRRQALPARGRGDRLPYAARRDSVIVLRTGRRRGRCGQGFLGRVPLAGRTEARLDFSWIIIRNRSWRRTRSRRHVIFCWRIASITPPPVATSAGPSRPISTGPSTGSTPSSATARMPAALP